MIGPLPQWERPVGKTSIALVLLFTLLSLITRFYRIHKGNFVV